MRVSRFSKLSLSGGLPSLFKKAIRKLGGGPKNTLPTFMPRYASFFRNRLGLEIGGPSTLFQRRNLIPLYPIVAGLDGCNFSDQTTWEGKILPGHTYRFGKRTGNQYISEAIDLNQIRARTYDFVVACHSLEHIANPLCALQEWARVLKSRGTLLLVLPNPTKTFDHRRQVTTIDHLLRDFETKIGEDDNTHLAEILELHDLERDALAGDMHSFRTRSMRNFENRCLHHHVFSLRSVNEMLNLSGFKVIYDEEAHPYHMIFLAQRVL